MKNTENFTDREWEELSALLSDERNDNPDLLSRFTVGDRYNTSKYWKELRDMNTDKEIDVDKAWNKLYSRLNENGLIQPEAPVIRRSFIRNYPLRIAAALIILLGIGALILNIDNIGIPGRRITVATTDNQKNLQVTLPDGSNIFLNRNTRLSYDKNFGRHDRKVSLAGEAFFEITSRNGSPFTVDAGQAEIRVLGTSFNVITSNTDSDVEVFVETGKVLVSSGGEENDMILDPGYVGTVNEKHSEKYVNDNANYMSWHKGLLIYDGQTLDIVFNDLKRVYNMDIVADDPEILSNTWTSPIDNQPQETIIRLICLSFNLNYKKDGNIYHLSKR